jgi:hypothetical protein
LLCEQRARDFDEAQVGDVVNDGGAIRIEEHDLHFGLNRRRLGVAHARIMAAARGGWKWAMADRTSNIHHPNPRQ